MKQRTLWILLLTFIFFNACSNEQDPVKNRILRVALQDNPTNLDPRTVTDAVSFRIVELCYDFLVRMDSTGLPQLALAQKLDQPSPVEYIFTLPPNVRFHDGRPLTAEDVVYTFNSILDPALKAPLRSSLEIIKSITAPDSLHVKFTLKEPHAPFLAHLAVGITPRHLSETNQRDLSSQPMGSGPFVFKQWAPHSFIELEKNSDYWNGPPPMNKVIIKILPEENTRRMALQNGEVDLLIGNVSETSLPVFQSMERLKIMRSPGSNYVYLGLNLRNRYLGNPLVRQAIAHALDIEGIIKNLLAGVHTRALSVLNKNHWAYNPDLQPYIYDPSLAKKLLDEAGFRDPDGDGPRTRFTLGYKTSSNLQSRQKAQVIQEYLRAVGIDVQIQSYEWGTFFDDVRNGRFDMFSLTIVGVYDPAVYRTFFQSASIGAAKNRVGYQNPEVDRLIEIGEKHLNIDRRRHAYQRIEEILHRELPVISLWHETNIAIMDKRLKGFRLYPAAEWRSLSRVYWEE